MSRGTGSGRGGVKLDLKVSGRKRGGMASEAEGAGPRGLGLTSPLFCTNSALELRPDTRAGDRSRGQGHGLRQVRRGGRTGPVLSRPLRRWRL